MDPLAIAASGLRGAELRFASSAHNVANLATPSFRPLRVTQTSVQGGGSRAQVHREARPREVDLAHELLQQNLGSLQFRASLRVFGAVEDTRGRLIDLLA